MLIMPRYKKLGVYCGFDIYQEGPSSFRVVKTGDNPDTGANFTNAKDCICHIDELVKGDQK